MNGLDTMQGWIIDLDGVLWRGQQALPGAVEFLDRLHAGGARLVLATNNATASPASVAARVRKLGGRVSPEEVVTSAQAAAEYLRQEIPTGSAVYAIGEDALRSALTQAGFRLRTRADGARAVVVGLDRQVDWEKLAEATLALRAGALFLGTNPDVTFPGERGQVPGNGALLAALRAASGREPVIVGKPEPHLFRAALERLHTTRDQTVVVGDRLDTDILGGRRAGLHTALVLTGVTHRDELESGGIGQLAAALQPDWVFDGLPELMAALPVTPHP